MTDNALDQGRYQAVADLADSIRTVIVAHVKVHGPDDPQMNAIVGAAISMVVAELTLNVDPLLGPSLSATFLRDYALPGQAKDGEP
jgi:hypothetical protein